MTVTTIDEFPAGMRVLAVDDNPTCLKLLETLLRKCQYHVTTTGHATTALKLLRKNRNQFDLVISDVDMPDMDGFKLLELVGLELDLPVIMLSSYGDTELVKKGVTYGACDYLLKPVRIEEVRNIWQHVLRRKILDSTERKISHKFAGEPGDSDHHGKLNRKRKDQNGYDDEKQDDNGQNYKDPLSQKKPRLVWSQELHNKFVDAVHQLGMKKAVPKRILKTMNVQKLTRENVASHLQKYREYLKKISRVESQQDNMTAAIQSPDSAFVHNGSLHGVANCQSMVARLNSPTGFGMHSLSSFGMIQSCHACIINPYYSSEQPTSKDLKGKMSSLASSMQTNPQNISGFASVLSGDLDTRIDFQCQTPLIMNSSTENLNFIMRQDSDALEQNSDALQQNAAFKSNILCHSISSSEPYDCSLGLFRHKSGTNFHVNSDEFSSVGQMDFLDPLPRQHATVGLAAEMLEQDYLEERMTPREYLDYNKIGSLEELVTSMMKEDHGNLSTNV